MEGEGQDPFGKQRLQLCLRLHFALFGGGGVGQSKKEGKPKAQEASHQQEIVTESQYSSTHPAEPPALSPLNRLDPTPKAGGQRGSQ